MKTKKAKTLYVCEFCGKESTSKKTIEKCETSCREKQKKNSIQAEKSKREFEEWFQVHSISQLENNISDFLTKKSGINCRAEFNVNPRESCSNTHSSPKGKPSNWGQKPDLPLGYVGLIGNINIHIDGGYNPKVSDIFSSIQNKYRICTGCGGSRSHGLGYSVTIWADDYPILGEKVNCYLNMFKQKNRYNLEVEEIEYAYENQLNKFIEEHEDYLAQQKIVEDACNKLNKIKLDLGVEFINEIPKPTPHAVKVTKRGVDLKLAEING